MNTLPFSGLLLYRNLLSEYGLIAKCLEHLHNKKTVTLMNQLLTTYYRKLKGIMIE